MKYNSIYYNLFKGPMKKVLRKHYGNDFAKKVIKDGQKVYKEIVLDTPEMGKGNPMGFNVLFSLVYFAPYLASNKKISLEVFDEMVKTTIEKVKILYTTTDLNTQKMKDKVKKRTQKYLDWYNEDRQRLYPESFCVDKENIPFDGACYSRITRCPINFMAKKYGVCEIMPYICGLDHVMANYRHGILYREHTIANNGDYCDFLLMGDKDINPVNK